MNIYQRQSKGTNQNGFTWNRKLLLGRNMSLSWEESVVRLIHLESYRKIHTQITHFITFLFIGVQLLYSVLLVSAAAYTWSISAICIHISRPSWTLPTPPPTHLGYHRVPSWAPYAIQQVKVESFCTAQNHKRDEKITLRMWDHYLQVKQQSINLQNIQTAHAAQCQRNKQPNQKMVIRPK